MQIDMEQRQGVLLVRLTGELDHHHAEQVREKVDREIARHHSRAVVFNLRGLAFMDSSGVGVLLGRYRKIEAAGGRVAVCEVPAAISRVTEISGLARIIPFFDREADALQHLLLGLPSQRRF